MRYCEEINVNRDLVRPGLYVHHVDHFGKMDITTFDLKFTESNANHNNLLSDAEIHTLEHLGRAILKDNPEWSEHIVYFGPKACRTGFYLLVEGNLQPKGTAKWGKKTPSVFELVRSMLWKIMGWRDPVPNATPEKCSNYKNHNLLSARLTAHKYYTLLSTPNEQLGYDKLNIISN